MAPPPSCLTHAWDPVAGKGGSHGDFFTGARSKCLFFFGWQVAHICMIHLYCVYIYTQFIQRPQLEANWPHYLEIKIPKRGLKTKQTNQTSGFSPEWSECHKFGGLVVCSVATWSLQPWLLLQWTRFHFHPHHGACACSQPGKVLAFLLRKGQWEDWCTSCRSGFNGLFGFSGGLDVLGWYLFLWEWLGLGLNQSCTRE